MKQTLRQVEIGKIHQDPDQPRKTFRQDEIDSLAKSIAAEGLLQPISVRPLKAYKQLNQHSEYRIVSGERRFRAIKQLGWNEISVLVVDVDDGAVAKLQLLENVVRQDLDPVEEAQAMKSMLDAGYSKQEIAEAVGKPTTFVTFALGMLNCERQILHLVKTKAIKPLAAYAVGSLSAQGQAKVRRAIVDGIATTTPQIQRLSERVNLQENQVEMFAPAEVELSTGDKQTVDDFNSAFDRVCRVLAKIDQLADDDPERLGRAFAAQGATVSIKITEMVKSLHRVRRSIDDQRIAEKVA